MNFDGTYRGGRLSGLFASKPAARATGRAQRDIVRRTSQHTAAGAAARTPIESGKTARSWKPLPVERTEEGYSGGAESRYFVARLLEYGVEPHDTEDEDGRTVRHPGVRPRYMLASATDEVNATWPATTGDVMRQWAEAVEREAKRHGGVS